MQIIITNKFFRISDHHTRTLRFSIDDFHEVLNDSDLHLKLTLTNLPSPSVLLGRIVPTYIPGTNYNSSDQRPPFINKNQPS